MRIEIYIPKEFEEHFNQDKFKDSLERIMADIKDSLENGDCSCAGRYEYETIEMLEKALENSRQAYPVDKVVEELKFIRHWKSDVMDDFCGYDCNSVGEAWHNGYNKSIDDFVNLAKEHEFKYKKEDITDCCIGFIEFFAKELKERETE